MKEQDKELLLKDLCARLPYDIEAQVTNNIEGESKPFIVNKILTFDDVNAFIKNDVVVDIKPYLRPMSSMTKEEEKEYSKFAHFGNILGDWTKSIDYLNAHHFDYRGLIGKGLALEAPNDMYN